MDRAVRTAARHVLTPDGLRKEAVVVRDPAGTILSIENRQAGEPMAEALLLPGLHNAHAHLELSHLSGLVPGGSGSVPWVRALFSARRPEPPGSREAAARAARHFGTARLLDVANTPGSVAAMTEAGLAGAVLRELIGRSPLRWQPALEEAEQESASSLVSLRICPHAPISCSPDLLRRSLAPGAAPWPTLHCEEDSADAALLSEAAGPWADFYDALPPFDPAPWRTSLGRARSGVALLHNLGLLRPQLGLVHLTFATATDLDLIADTGATAVLCPRSNQHITGHLPDVPGMLQRNIPLALGTDSLASSPDLDVLAEATHLHRAFPQVDPQIWLIAATHGGARLFGQRATLRPGTRPTLLQIALPPTQEPLAALLGGAAGERSWP